MCGRFVVYGDYDPRGQLGINARDFNFQRELDLSPGQTVNALCQQGAKIDWQPLQWGIQPQWSRQLIINARAETAASKPTFASAFAHQRCLIPCRGWYEWRAGPEADPARRRQRKQRYLFSAEDSGWLLMAGLWFTQGDQLALVILTTAADAQCAPYHDRMPWLQTKQQGLAWLEGGKPELAQPIGSGSLALLVIEPVSEPEPRQPSPQRSLF